MNFHTVKKLLACGSSDALTELEKAAGLEHVPKMSKTQSG